MFVGLYRMTCLALVAVTYAMGAAPARWLLSKTGTPKEATLIFKDKWDGLAGKWRLHFGMGYLTFKHEYKPKFLGDDDDYIWEDEDESWVDEDESSRRRLFGSSYTNIGSVRWMKINIKVGEGSQHPEEEEVGVKGKYYSGIITRQEHIASSFGGWCSSQAFHYQLVYGGKDLINCYINENLKEENHDDSKRWTSLMGKLKDEQDLWEKIHHSDNDEWTALHVKDGGLMGKLNAVKEGIKTIAPKSFIKAGVTIGAALYGGPVGGAVGNVVLTALDATDANEDQVALNTLLMNAALTKAGVLNEENAGNNDGVPNTEGLVAASRSALPMTRRRLSRRVPDAQQRLLRRLDPRQ